MNRFAIAAAICALGACNAAEESGGEPPPATSPVSAAPADLRAPAPTGTAAPTGIAAPSGIAAYDQRLSAVEAAISAWQSAPDIAAAHRAAETARNLVVGPAGPYYGDSDGDGAVAGASSIGLLPGRAGEPGIAAAGLNRCIDRDVRGGDWGDPAGRWAILDRAIRAWSPASNPFPTLPSHPQRIVGWASLTLATQDVAKARDFAGHARIHSDVSRRALERCG